MLGIKQSLLLIAVIGPLMGMAQENMAELDCLYPKWVKQEMSYEDRQEWSKECLAEYEYRNRSQGPVGQLYVDSECKVKAEGKTMNLNMQTCRKNDSPKSVRVPNGARLDLCLVIYYRGGDKNFEFDDDGFHYESGATCQGCIRTAMPVRAGQCVALPGSTKAGSRYGFHPVGVGESCDQFENRDYKHEKCVALRAVQRV